MVRLHRWLGLASGSVILVVCATAIPMAFEDEINRVLHPAWFAEAPTADLDPDEWMAALPQGFRSGSVTIYRDGSRLPLIAGRSSAGAAHIAFDPVSRQQFVYEREHGWYMSLFRIHRGLVAGQIGRTVVGAATLIFILVMLTGAFVWWPRKRQRFRDVATMRYRGRRLSRLLADFHKVWGSYAVLVLLVLAVTGLPFAYSWASEAAIAAGGGERQQPGPSVPEALREETRSYTELLERAEYLFPDSERFVLSIPAASSRPASIRAFLPQRLHDDAADVAFLSSGDGELLRLDRFDDMAGGTRVRSLMLPIHTGSILGLGGRILAALACLVAVLLPVTGVVMWYPAWRLRRKRRESGPRRS
ncbi:MAG: PepSY domain-containing protein [Rhodothermales bacterium]|nr:PepSY domain-containing protein [Rhodothermales bacterium]MBO6780649.1 PepSY domain-containing protein [Rhodothermales bacterium]